MSLRNAPIPSTPTTLWQDLIDITREADYNAAREPYAPDSTTMHAITTFDQLHIIEQVDADIATYLAGIASGILPSTT